jgi:uncharacterized protein YfaT (DUF1175 family)
MANKPLPKRLKKLAIDSFSIEWELRRMLMKAAHCSQEALTRHRVEVLQRYGLTEADVPPDVKKTREKKK